MCGRYYIDDETSREIEKLLKQWSEKGVKEAVQGDLQAEVACKSPGDVHGLLFEIVSCTADWQFLLLGFMNGIGTRRKIHFIGKISPLYI